MDLLNINAKAWVYKSTVTWLEKKRKKKDETTHYLQKSSRFLFSKAPTFSTEEFWAWSFSFIHASQGVGVENVTVGRTAFVFLSPS